VQSGRGQCVDPPIQSYGTISFYKAISPQPSQSSEYFSAVFPAGPALVPPAAGSGAVETIAILSPVPLNLRSCPVPGYSDLSAGAITIQPPAGSGVTVQPQPFSAGGASYSQSLPTGFLGPGAYTISGSSGGQFALNTSIQLGSLITIQTNLASGTTISNSQPLTVQWTGGDSSSVVTVTLITGQGMASSPVPADAGSVTLRPPCNAATGGCGFATALSSAQISVSVAPASAAVVTLPGITFPVRLNWQYSYQFTGLILSN
jgi:hypothetical protein